MIKIIKYSITLIIFSIIISLFVLYFYLLKGFTINNINTDFISIGKLYIKIDKKISFQAKNIIINYKTNPDSKKTKLNFKQIKSIINKSIKALEFFQKIDIENLTINKLNITSIIIQKNRLILDNKNLYLNTSLKYTKKDLILDTSNLNIKKLNLNIKNIHTILHFSKYQVKIINNIFYRKLNSITHITLTNNEKIFYQGDIFNISKYTLNLLTNKLKIIKNFNIHKISFNGNLNTLSFKLTNTKLVVNKKQILKIPLLRGRLNIKENILYSSNKNLYILINNNKINLYNTTLHYEINKKIGYAKNSKITIENIKGHIILLNNKIYYTKKLSNIKTKSLKIYNKKINININNLKAQYIKKQLYAYIHSSQIKFKNFNSKIYDTVIAYNNNNLYVNIPSIETNSSKINSKLMNTNINYKDNIISSNIDKVFIDSYGVTGDIYKNKILYNLKNNNLKILTSKTDLNYLKIKNIILNNIITTFKNSILKSNASIGYANNIKVSDINFTMQNKIINVIFNTNSLLSKKLNNLLSNFDIKIPIYQKTGENNITTKLSYNINNSKFHTDVKIKVKKSQLMLTDTNSINIPYANLELNDSMIKIKNTLIKYNESIINTKYYIRTGKIDLNKSYIQTYGKFYDLDVKGITDIKNYPENIHIDLNGIDILLENLKVDIFLHKNITVNINKLSKFYSYIDYLKDYQLKNGKVKIKINNNISIDSNITNTTQKILLKNLKPIKKININTLINNNNYIIYNPNFKINMIDNNNTTIINGKYKNLDINITKFIDANNSDNNSSSNIKAKIKGINSYILYHKNKLYSKNLKIDYNNSYAKIVSLYKDRNITIEYNNGAFKIYGLNIKDKTFKDLTNTDILNNTLIKFFAIKSKNSDLIQGFVNIKKGYIKDLKAFNNIIAFINLVPSLITFQPAGFSLKGYKIKHGYIKYSLINNILYLKEITIKGENMSFNGKGYINLKKKIMDINVNINLIIKLIKDIPIVNYILLGKNGGITLNVTVKGDINNPSIHKNTISNIIKAPIGIIKRLILTPFRPFMNKEEQ